MNHVHFLSGKTFHISRLGKQMKKNYDTYNELKTPRVNLCFTFKGFDRKGAELSDDFS